MRYMGSPSGSCSTDAHCFHSSWGRSMRDSACAMSGDAASSAPLSTCAPWRNVGSRDIAERRPAAKQHKFMKIPTLHDADPGNCSSISNMATRLPRLGQFGSGRVRKASSTFEQKYTCFAGESTLHPCSHPSVNLYCATLKIGSKKVPNAVGWPGEPLGPPVRTLGVQPAIQLVNFRRQSSNETLVPTLVNANAMLQKREEHRLDFRVSVRSSQIYDQEFDGQTLVSSHRKLTRDKQ